MLGFDQNPPSRVLYWVLFSSLWVIVLWSVCLTFGISGVAQHRGIERIDLQAVAVVRIWDSPSDLYLQASNPHLRGIPNVDPISQEERHGQEPA